MTSRPETTKLGFDLEISRILTGLWQIADIEKDGKPVDLDAAADHLSDYAAAGFTTFDMADHYGNAELVAGRLLARHGEGADRPLAFTKWCPEPGPMTEDVVRAGVQERLDRLGVSRVDLLQFHWWTFEHPGWLDALKHLARLREEGLIGEIGVTNFDAAHLHVALAENLPIVSNQVSFSVVDRRAAGALSDLCARTGVRLLAYGTLCGGFLSERWLGKPEPAEIADWSRMKYKRFIDAAGGWEAFQALLAALGAVARRHGVSISNVATRWVLETPSVAGVIIGARIGESEHRADNLKLFGFALDDTDRARLEEAFAGMAPIPGDCGDEYRRPPFLTASGDLSHHLERIPSIYQPEPVPGRANRWLLSSGSIWEPLAGFSRAMRVGDRILVSGTTATHGADHCVAPGDAEAQTTYVLDKIAAALAAFGASMEDVVRTRVYLQDVGAWEGPSRAHGRVFGDIRPANTTLAVGSLIGGYEVEIEVEAVLDPR
ncbi:aldo/keto reductase [Stappia sp. MMSF_3263]|uniref:aldo/keto reductase n=1 Tax=Stappia sp. MMSF_3263 TaxID=3046693 RepID=UPI00273E51E6|nr:aldo/keto reductase [Stappia sp. MMSF_3263]